MASRKEENLKESKGSLFEPFIARLRGDVGQLPITMTAKRVVATRWTLRNIKRKALLTPNTAGKTAGGWQIFAEIKRTIDDLVILNHIAITRLAFLGNSRDGGECGSMGTGEEGL